MLFRNTVGLAALAAALMGWGCNTEPAAPDTGVRDTGVADADAGIADSGVDAGPSGPQQETIGDDTLVTLTEGSLIPERPTDDATRFDALVSYLRSDPGRFGAAGVEPSSLTFVEAVAQNQIKDEAGATFTLVALHQTFMNAPVIDEMQMAIFASTTDGDELRRVRAHLRDPATLPTPPDPTVVSPGRIAPTVADLIATYALSADATTTGDAPVIVAGDAIAGYPVSQFVPSETGALGRFRAVVDPSDMRVSVIVNQPPCDASRPPPAGETLVDVPHTAVPIPGLTDLRFIRVQAVVVSNDDGSSRSSITNDQIKIWVDEANALWTPEARIVLLFDATPGSEDVSAWSSSILNVETTNDAEDSVYSATGNLIGKVLYPHRLVIFFRKFGTPGWSWGPQTDFFISMPEYTNGGIWKPLSGGLLPNDRLLAHELGHYMGLAHTFPGGACAELTPLYSDGDATGQLPNDPSDDVLDTNSDLSDVCYPTESLMCIGGGIIYNDLTWLPPWNNIMSYHDCLPQDISDDQVAVIDHTMMNPNRSVLLE